MKGRLGAAAALGPKRIGALLALLPVLVRLTARILKDERVPRRHRLVLAGSLGYAALPIDLIPDFIVGIGKVDDIVVMAAGLAWALKFAPPSVVEEHLAAMGLDRAQLETMLLKVVPDPIERAWQGREVVVRPLATGLSAAARAAARAADALAEQLKPRG